MNKKILVFMIIIILIIIITSLIIKFVIQREVNNIPFQISKIIVVSTAETENQENTNNEQIWNLNVMQNNDMYIDILKNEGNEIIDKLIILD